MKKMFLILATAALSLGSFAGNPDDNKGRKNDPDKYCAELKDGYLKVMHNGEVVTQTVMLDNGTKIGADGMITKASGETQMLKEGECVNLDGMIESGSPENKGTGEPDKTKMNRSDKDKMNKEPMKSDKDKMDKEPMNKSDKDKMDKDQMNRPDKDMDQDKTPRSNKDKSGNYEKKKSAEPYKDTPAKDKDKYEEPK